MAKPTVPAQPFADWLNKRVVRYESLEEMAEAFGTTERTLYRYRHCLAYDGTPTEVFDRDTVDNMLRHAGFWLFDVYDLEDSQPDLKPFKTLMQTELLLDAKAAYEAGASFPEVAAELFEGSGYATVGSLKQAFEREFRNQGWPSRGFSEAAKMARIGWEPPSQCRAVAKKKGRRCQLVPLSGSAFCWLHSPETRDVCREQTLRIRERCMENLVPLEPFSEWLRGCWAEVGTQKLLAERIGRTKGEVARWVYRKHFPRKGVANEMKWVRRDTVVRVLEAWGDGTTVEDLYERVAA